MMNFREKIEEVKPREIEEKSFAIISEELGTRDFAPNTELIVKRCIHTSADFDYADNLCFSQDAAVKAMAAIKRGVSVVTDTNMAKAGINKVSLAKYGGTVHCFMADPDVAEAARRHGTTRASESMKKAAGLGEPFIYAIGNAPTALVSLYDLIQEGKVKPELIIGRAGRLRQCRPVQGTDYECRCALHRGTRPQRRKQYRRLHRQCLAVHDR